MTESYGSKSNRSVPIVLAGIVLLAKMKMMTPSKLFDCHSHNSRITKLVRLARLARLITAGICTRPLFFFIYINDIIDNIDCNVRLLVGDTSHFCTVNNEYVTRKKLNRNLERLRLRVWQLKMQFNTYKTKEIIFSNKRLITEHPPTNLANKIIAKEHEHRHPGVTLDSRLNLQSHINETNVKALREIGVIRHISNIIGSEIFDQNYKLYVRPHLDYWDIICHKFDSDRRLDLT